MQFPLDCYGYILEGMAKDFQDLNNGQVLEELTFKTDKMSEMLEKHFSLFEFLEDDLRVSGGGGLVIIIKNKLLQVNLFLKLNRTDC